MQLEFHDFHDLFRNALRWGTGGMEKEEAITFPPKKTCAQEKFASYMSTSNLLYLLTELLPEPLEVRSSNSLLLLTSGNTFCFLC